MRSFLLERRDHDDGWMCRLPCPGEGNYSYHQYVICEDWGKKLELWDRTNLLVSHIQLPGYTPVILKPEGREGYRAIQLGDLEIDDSYKALRTIARMAKCESDSKGTVRAWIRFEKAEDNVD